MQSLDASETVCVYGEEEGKMKYRRGCEGVKIKNKGSRRKEIGQRQRHRYLCQGGWAVDSLFVHE